MAIDGTGDIFIASDNKVSKIDPTGAVSTINVNVNSIAADAAGDLFIADASDNVVWEWTKATNTIAVVAGTGAAITSARKMLTFSSQRWSSFV